MDISNPTAIIARAPLALALASLKHAADIRGTIPVLANVLLRESSGGMEAITTDLENTMTVALDGAVCDPGFAVTLPVKTLAGALDSAGGDDVEVMYRPCEPDTVDARCMAARVTCGTLCGNMDAIHAADFPEAKPFGHVTAEFDLPSADLVRAIKATEVAVSTEETRYYLNGIFMHLWRGGGNDAPELRFVATDGHKLARFSLPAPAELAALAYRMREAEAADRAAREALREALAAGHPADSMIPVDAANFAKETAFSLSSAAEKLPRGVIIPAPACKLLLRMAGEKGAPATVRITINTSKAIFKLGAVTILAKMIDGTFPDYERVIPAYDLSPNRATFDRDHFLTAIKTVTGGQRGHYRTIKVVVDEGVVKVSHRAEGASDYGMVATLAQCAWEGRPGYEIGFNVGYVEKLLKTLPKGKVQFCFSEPGSPALLLPLNAGGYPEPARCIVIMPMRV